MPALNKWEVAGIESCSAHHCIVLLLSDALISDSNSIQKPKIKYMSTAKKPETKSAPKSGLLIVSSSTAKLVSAAAALGEVCASLNATATIQEGILEQIAQSEARLAELDVQFTEVKRAKEVELTLALQENAALKVSAVLSSQGKVAIPQAELSDLKSQLAKLQTDFAKEVATEVGKAKGIAETAATNAIKIAKLEQDAVAAKQVAEIESLKAQLAAAQTTIQNYIGQINSERQARVDEAKARGNAVVNVSNTK